MSTTNDMAILAGRYGRRPDILLLCCVLLFALPLASGCAGRREAKARAAAPELVLGEVREDFLHCDKGRCSNWYRLVVRQQTGVRLEADSPVDAALPDFGLVLKDHDLAAMGEDRIPGKRPRKIAKPLLPGVYFVNIWGLEGDGDLLSYKLVAKRDSARKRPARATRKPSRSVPKAAPAPPKPPAAKLVESDLLEVERQGGEPVAVLLEVGTSDGMEPGLQGELVDQGKVIGRIEIVDVYAAGSRARLVGGLSAPITLETTAKIQKPAGARR